jgi:predicted AAA+ superfamily ATPase
VVALRTPLRDALTDALVGSLEGPIPDGTPRLVHGTVRLPGKVTAVVGARRAGKTTFVHQLRRERLAGSAEVLVPYVSFEDERLAEVEASQLGFLVDELARRIPSAARGSVLWCFDEIQQVPGWERFVRRLLDSGTAEIVVTGSSAALLSSEIGTALRGRAWKVPLYPFSFAEVLAHRGVAVPPEPGELTGEALARVEHELLRWLETGGFPEAQSLEGASRRQLLRDYVDVAMLRDVVERHEVSNVTGLRWLVRHLLGNAGSAFSVEKFHRGLKSQGIAISRDTLHQLLAHLEDCFLVRTVWMESDSERQRMVNPRKAYPADAGLIPVFDRTGKANLGHALETAVLVELERRRCEVTYVRTPEGHEVDFLARDAEGALHLIQVCADARDPATAERELRALRSAAQRYRARCWLLTSTRDAAPTEIPDGVTAWPAHRWLLAAWTGD